MKEQYIVLSEKMLIHHSFKFFDYHGTPCRPYCSFEFEYWNNTRACRRECGGEFCQPPFTQVQSSTQKCRALCFVDALIILPLVSLADVLFQAIKLSALGITSVMVQSRIHSQLLFDHLRIFVPILVFGHNLPKPFRPFLLTLPSVHLHLRLPHSLH
jgi:hypothetical protein